MKTSQPTFLLFEVDWLEKHHYKEASSGNLISAQSYSKVAETVCASSPLSTEKLPGCTLESHAPLISQYLTMSPVGVNWNN